MQMKGCSGVSWAQCIIITLAICFAVLLGFRLHAQTQGTKRGVPDRAYQFSAEQMQVSKLDWIMLVARVRLMEHTLAVYGSQKVSPYGMEYDKNTKRISIAGLLDPVWMKNVKLDEVKKELEEQGSQYCIFGVGAAESQVGEVLSVMNLYKDCDVAFFTWERGKDGSHTRKDVATFEDGKLVLK